MINIFYEKRTNETKQQQKTRVKWLDILRPLGNPSCKLAKMSFLPGMHGEHKSNTQVLEREKDEEKEANLSFGAKTRYFLVKL